jgi:valyl-tRNA synthetase
VAQAPPLAQNGRAMAASEIPKAYDPKKVEDKWYAQWLERGHFTANPSSTKPAYSIVIPPPNVTGVLTMGHVLNNTLQDILARRKRMQGYEVLWLPGTDHAGIATQTVVEKTLKKSGKIKHRDDLGREKFLEKVWEWKEKHGGIIIQQLKKLGCSCDWTRERFTMDEHYSRCVLQVFVELYKKGLIYRGKRMVNWDPAARTALSDEEVIMTETKGHLWHLKYPLVDSDEFLVVATTRPETMLGDEAVAVHPDDERYKHFVGKKALLPLRNKQIPIIADAAVDPKFGTGCVKVTPAHDVADYEIALRHNLPFTVVIGPDGKMTGEAGEEFEDLDRFECREAVVEELKEQNLLLKVEDYTHNVGYSDRSHVPIEPYLSEQWFLKYPQVERSLDAVERGEIKFYPERWVKTYAHWMKNLKDWCISRQLWWGHRIPVWYRGDEIYVGIEPPKGSGWQQDPDVLDTWFSSWLWPFATMGWPEKTETLKKFYPTTDLVTGPDIIFFWVARMIVAGYEFMDEKPFHNVYFTGIIRDAIGRKMSKSLGNSPDPLDLISKYGADGLRFGLMLIAPQGQDILFDEKRCEVGRNFMNKLWNAARFLQLQRQKLHATAPKIETDDDRFGRWSGKPNAHEQKILFELNACIKTVHDAFESYEFNTAAKELYDFVWGDFCDWYLETTKIAANPQQSLEIFEHVFHNTLRLLHPFAPFITEELWRDLGYGNGETIQFAPWPWPIPEVVMKNLGATAEKSRAVEQMYELVRAGRQLRNDYNIEPKRKVPFVFKPLNAEITALLRAESDSLAFLLGAERISVDENYKPSGVTPSLVAEIATVFMPGAVDVGAERARLQKQRAETAKFLATIESKLANESFVARAPAQIVADEREKAQKLREQLAKIDALLAALK